jgi:type I restriction enzyme R subunit
VALSRSFTESVVEEAALDWLHALGYTVLHGPEIAFGESAAERTDPDYRDVLLHGRLRRALSALNWELPQETIDDAYRKLLHGDTPSLVERNRTLHRFLVEGVAVEYRRADGTIAGTQARLIDFDNPFNNDWVVVNQFTVQGERLRRPDIVIFVNGLPLAVIELKNAADENASVWKAFSQLRTYQTELPSLFATNVVLLASDGLQARVGTIGAGKEWFKPWRTIAGDGDASPNLSELEVSLFGIFEKRRFFDLVRHFIVFEDEGGGKIVKKMAGYHQFHAVNVAVEETLRASRIVQDADAARDQPDGVYGSHASPGGEPGDRRIGVIWHTQGSGKSLTMAFYAGRLILHPAMRNPTVVVITDRNDLDDQLFGTFARCQDLLRQPPVQAEDRQDLRRKLSVAAGGVVFTTIQKFMPDESGETYPVLSERTNIVVMADEAHRSQYEFGRKLDKKGKLRDGFAQHMRQALPNASFIGFTGTPVELKDRNTRAVFGDYISVYDIQRAVRDDATVKIYYESRLATLQLKESERPKIDDDFDAATEGDEVEHKERLKSKWAQLEAIVGTEARIKRIAKDLAEHFEQRLAVMDGKAMVVCMSRRICVALYDELVALRKTWGSDKDDEGSLKVIMTGSASDPQEWQGHIRNKARREALAKRFRDPADPFRIVIVRDMWLTGFDAPSMHTMYVDKPMQGHGLMQAIARVNRVFKDKPGGLVVDYFGLADELKAALITYTESGGKGEAAIDQEKAVAVLIEKWEVCKGLLHGFDWSRWITGTSTERLTLISAALEHVLAQENGKPRLLKAVIELSSAFALSVPHERAMTIRDEVSFFQALRAALVKRVEGEDDEQADEKLDHTVRQILSRAVVSGDVVDIFAAAGLKKPDISILSDDFLAQMKGMPQRNLAVELLQRLLKGQLRGRMRNNVVQARSFLQLLENALQRYQNRTIEAAQVIDELIKLAKDMRAAAARGASLGLTDDEVAFYDALEANDSAVKILGDDVLRAIARELVATVRASVTIDWTVRDNVRAQLRVLIKRILRRHGYPPDKQEKATQTVLEQAEVLSEQWAGNNTP